MIVVRMIILLILGAGLLAGVGALHDNAGPVLLGMVLFVTFGGLLRGYLQSAGSRSSTPRHRYRGRITKGDIAAMRRDYDADKIKTARAAYSDYYFDSYGYKRDPRSGEYLYMNASNTPNKDAFAGMEGKTVEYDGGDVYQDENGNFWRDV